MSSKTIDGIRFNAYSNDHDPPHIDAEVDGMKMKLVFATDETPAYPINDESTNQGPGCEEGIQNLS